jgi:hypothetical protein
VTAPTLVRAVTAPVERPIANWVVAVSFLTLLSAISSAGTFFLMAGLTLVAIAYFWKKVPGPRG